MTRRVRRRFREVQRLRCGRIAMLNPGAALSRHFRSQRDSGRAGNVVDTAAPDPELNSTKSTHRNAALSVSKHGALYKCERWYGQDHTLILPSMQVTVLPPTQISSPSSST